MSLFDRVANQIGQNYLSKLGQLSPLVKFGTDIISGKLTSSVRAGDKVLTGGITLKNYAKIMDEFMAIDLARRNLFMFSAVNLATGTAPEMNMLVQSVSYSPFTVRGDAIQIGAGSMDNVTGVEPVQMTVQTLDDVGGSVKTWFKNLKRQMAPGDGTVGLPLDYLIRVSVTHAFASNRAKDAGRAYIDSYVMRPNAIEFEGDRRDDGLQEITLSFVEFDTFSNLF